MIVVYFSLTGQTKRFVGKLPKHINTLEITEHNVNTLMEDEFVLVIPTYALELVRPVLGFLSYTDNYHRCVGVVGTGNRNFADFYIHTAHTINKIYNIPIVYDFEFSGVEQDLDNFIRIIHEDNT